MGEGAERKCVCFSNSTSSMEDEIISGHFSFLAEEESNLVVGGGAVELVSPGDATSDASVYSVRGD